MMDVFAELFGPYPFAGYTVVVTDDDLEIPLEAQGLSIFGANLLDGRLGRRAAGRARAGAPVVRQQPDPRRAGSDIWLHEGFACYAEWLWSEESGGETADGTRAAAPRSGSPTLDAGPACSATRGRS